MNIDWSKLTFHYTETDYIVRAACKNGVWEQPYATRDKMIPIHAAATGLHYGQECFEGLKAYTTADGRDVKNIMTCDRECNSKVKDQSMNNKTTDATSYAVIHLINGVLNHEELANGQYPDFANGSEARKYIQKFAIR